MRPLIVIICCLVAVGIHAQSISPNNFYGIWHLDKYSDAEQYYHPPKKEGRDYIALRRDMTCTTVAEGEKTEGTWLYNTNGQYLELRMENEEKEKLFVHYLSAKSMVATYDTDEYRVWEVHFVKEKQEE